MKLIVNSRYVNRGQVYEAGTIDVDEEEGRFLLADAPGVFEEYVEPELEPEPEPEPEPEKKPRGRAVKKPARDKAVKEPESK